MNDSENPILNECSVCLKEEIPEDNKCITNCSHNYCKECLDQWFDQGKTSCPICRQQIQYFTHQSSDTRVVCVLNSSATVTRREYQYLMTINLRFKFYILMLTISFFAMVCLYLNSNVLSNSYLHRLHHCEHNNSLLNQEIKEYTELEETNQFDLNNENDKNYENDDTSLLVTVLHNHYYKKCYMPLINYNHCFNF